VDELYLTPDMNHTAQEINVIHSKAERLALT
jgi:hypothetical protein